MWWWGASSGVQRGGPRGWWLAGWSLEMSRRLLSGRCSATRRCRRSGLVIGRAILSSVLSARKAGNREFVGGGHLLRPIVFDSRLVQKPTPLRALLTVVWFPIGFLLACLRITAGSLLPMPFVSPSCAFSASTSSLKEPSLRLLFRRPLRLLHRTLLDPIFSPPPLRRPVPALTYSSLASQSSSPITTIRLSTNRSTDAATIRRLLAQAASPSARGTTCHEPFFDSLAVCQAHRRHRPVAMENRIECSMARRPGVEGMDPFYFFMNPESGL
ncbi:hypothetical protein HPP92_019931 [Vanilla planifolia]|uniref:Uncharacterized protein n=1 Tax=Vanilla planifolia TaxID=51239 RepID=A0A835QAL8_VANPL|nr:hypothetical protein HPP92_019931 [Vanilla planifolia]